MNLVSDALLKSRRRVVILLFSVLIGLNIVVAVSYFASTVVNSINRPLFELSSGKLITTLFQTIFLPLLALVGSIIGYYFGSISTKGVRGFGDEDASIADRTIRWARTTRVIQPLRKAFLAAIVLTSHVVLAIVMIGLIYGLQLLLKQLWAERHLQFFDKVPVSYFFDAGYAGVLLVFLIFGILEAARILRMNGR